MIISIGTAPNKVMTVLSAVGAKQLWRGDRRSNLLLCAGSWNSSGVQHFIRMSSSSSGARAWTDALYLSQAKAEAGCSFEHVFLLKSKTISNDGYLRAEIVELRLAMREGRFGGQVGQQKAHKLDQLRKHTECRYRIRAVLTQRERQRNMPARGVTRLAIWPRSELAILGSTGGPSAFGSRSLLL